MIFPQRASKEPDARFKTSLPDANSDKISSNYDRESKKEVQDP